MREFAEHIVYCNGIVKKESVNDTKYLELEHREGRKNKNVNINLNNFVTKLYKLENRYKDLLEIAGYIFAADRKTYRGKDDDLEYHSWSRGFEFHIKVRDYSFWNREETKELLKEVLCFMSGDHNYNFTFHKAEPDFPTSIFDTEKFVLDKPNNLKVVLFSGGIDSLAGVIELLETTKGEICLVSHQSGQPGVIRTQKSLYDAISEVYPGRCKHYKFHCGLSHTKSKDETQRTRSFLYTSTAFAIAKTYKQNSIYVYENGITSINFAETQDLMNARASRTTHPKTIGLLEKLFTLIAEEDFKIQNPYLLKTKTEVLEVIKKYKRLDLLDSSVSCSTTRIPKENFTHCGICSQCIDRRFAVYAADADNYDDNGIYHTDFLRDDLESDELKKGLTEYIRLAQNNLKSDIDRFYIERGNELVEIEEYIEGATELERIDKLYNMYQKHSKQIEYSIERMRKIYDKPLAPYNPKSFFNVIISPRVYQKEEIKKVLDEKKITEKEIPSRGLKKLAKETCEALIKKHIIKEVLKETKIKKNISSLIIAELKQNNYTVTYRNEKSINDYFRKYELQLKKDNDGTIQVIDTYNRRR